MEERSIMEVPKIMSQGWGKVTAAAKYAGVSVRTVRTWIKKGLKHSRLPTGLILIQYSDIDEYLESFSTTEDKIDRIVEEVLKGFK
jgi:excisionase family DNA binding protein